jgi:excisionase family DNA binding protein
MIITAQTKFMGAVSEAKLPTDSGGLIRHLITKRELCVHLGVSRRTLDTWIAEKRIPYLRLSGRLLRFNLPRVLASLAKYEVHEVGGRR